MKIDVSGKRVLDACCGGRMMWFDSRHPDAFYMDIRDESHVLCDGRVHVVSPDVVGDFRAMPFEDCTFNLVVLDPPHMVKLGKTSWLAAKYGTLLPTWEHDIKAGFEECMRVLKEGGTLVFKWNEDQVKVSKILDVIGCKPLFGHRTAGRGKTIWMVFMK